MDKNSLIILALLGLSSNNKELEEKTLKMMESINEMAQIKKEQ